MPLIKTYKSRLPSIIIQVQSIHVNHEITPWWFSSFARTIASVMSSVGRPCYLALPIIHKINSRVSMQLQNQRWRKAITSWAVWSMAQRKDEKKKNHLQQLRIISTHSVFSSSFSNLTKPFLSARPLLPIILYYLINFFLTGYHFSHLFPRNYSLHLSPPHLSFLPPFLDLPSSSSNSLLPLSPSTTLCFSFSPNERGLAQ